MNSRRRAALLGFGLTLAGAIAGCGQHPAQVAPPQAPVVPVSQPVQRNVTDYVDFTGRTDAVNTVNIVPRVTGYLVKMPFKEGSLVKKDDLLFEVDPRPYKAQLDQAEGQVKLYQAQLKLAKATLGRDVEISKTPGAVSPQQLDQDRAAVAQAEASVQAAKASLEVFKLNLSFCSVTSPIDGMVARYYLTLGNLVNQDQTLLTTVVSLDPMYAYFDMDEPTLVQIRQAIAAGKIKPYQEGKIPTAPRT
ncbi:MAG TPA: efflux RND transporter periplasmic adaptor subunit [Gemmataceae bacterium]|nr:efflux RND transporter periplasmic adaptor subunit [Gemmataceae bacterium]